MIQSMTGYAAASAPLSPLGVDGTRGTLSIELRSVNSRFLDLQFRVSDELRALEPLLRELVSARVTRGKLDCRAYLRDANAVPAGTNLNKEAVERLRELELQVSKVMPSAGPLRIADILRWPGVIAEPTIDEEHTRRVARDLCKKVLDELVASRTREGEKLAAAISQRVAAMRKSVDQATPLVPQALVAYQAKLTERLREAIGNADDERVRAEMALFAAKADVDEELTRLRTHLTEVDRILKQGGAAGKRLDFIAQELNREANTLASKAVSPELSDCALELKLLVEQVREQVQNIE
jgi:uncharacterized protein (TIGR00255 family)